MRESVIVSAVRTPTGKFLGALKGFTAPELGALVVEASGPQWAREVTRSADLILTRLQTLLGKDTITSITVRTPNAER